MLVGVAKVVSQCYWVLQEWLITGASGGVNQYWYGLVVMMVE